MNRIALYIALLFSISFTACSKTFYHFETIPQKPMVHYGTDDESAKDIVIDVNYASADLDLSVFEVDVYNGSADTILLSNRQVNLALMTDYYSEGALLYPLEKELLINEHLDQRQQLQQEKKRNTFWNIFTSGLTLISIVSASGTLTANTIGFAAESTAYILEDRSYYNALSGTIEDRILYIEDWVLDEIKIAPGQKGAFDLLFEHVISDGEISLEIKLGDHLYMFPYLLETKKVKR